MIKVKNQKILRQLSRKSLKANRMRNLMAILAIMLTTLMFTAFLTIGGTLIHSFQQQNFRQLGGDAHGTFKNVSAEQIADLKRDPLIVNFGVRKMLGMPTKVPFNKAHVEISYMDEVNAKSAFCIPEKGRLPKEGTDEIACDTRILQLLGVTPKVGEKLTFTYEIGSGNQKKQVTDTFTLSGFWTYDEASMASHAIVPLTYVEQILEGYKRVDEHDVTGQWSMNVYLKNTRQIKEDLERVLINQGYQCSDEKADNFIKYGVNWGYVNAQISGTADTGNILAMIGLLLLMALTGYLIIYNIFQISVRYDIRFYGLLKTLGMTGKQIRQMVLRQALMLSILGIPLGLLGGFFCGKLLAPVVMATLSYQEVHTTSHPLIFIGGAVFTLLTVLISCRQPAKIASKVSPVEAVCYTENDQVKKKRRQTKKKTSSAHMALANLSRNKKKTLLVILSLSLAVVILQITVVFTRGFDMDKYLEKWVVSDFILGEASYFQTSGGGFERAKAVSEESIEVVHTQGKIVEAGRIYGTTELTEQFIGEDVYRSYYEYLPPETLEMVLEQEERNERGEVADRVQLYGMEKFPLDQLTVVEGELGPLYDPNQQAIAAVCFVDDYGKVRADSAWAKVGDEVTIRYIEAFEYRDIVTGEKIVDPEMTERGYKVHPIQYKDVTYTVTALVTMRHSMSYRYYGADEFILNAEVFKRDSGTDAIMTYLWQTTEETNEKMEAFLGDYTTQIDPTLDYESKQSYVKEFQAFRIMFLLMGSVLAGIVGFVGILNFFNAMFTTIMTRRREFAMLQAIGMTGKQLKTMLVWEGALYGVGVMVVSLGVSLVTSPLLDPVMSSMFWFFTYRFTLIPILGVTPLLILVGMILPLMIYKNLAKQSLVERLRSMEE